MSLLARSAILFLMLLSVSCETQQLEKYDLLLKNARVVDVIDGELSDRTFILIRKGVIVSMTEDDAILDGKTFEEILDVNDKYIIPGLWDMHAHPDDPEVWRMDPRKEDRDYLMPLFVINGVTGIRDMAGDLEMVSRWRALDENDRLLVPRIVAGGPLLDGPNPMWDGSIGIENPDRVPFVVDSLIESGVDFLKVYSLLPRDTYFALAAYANKIRFPFVGHVPLTVLPSEAATTGMRSQEHLLEILNETVRDKAGLEALDQIEDGLERYVAKNEYLIENFDPSKMDSLNQLFVKNDIYHTPTLSMWMKNAWFEEEELKDDSLIQYLPGYLRKYWTVGVNDHLNHRDKPGFVETKKKLYFKYLELVKAMDESGVKLLAGTDMGANPLCFPGTGLHSELKELVRAGLTPLEALQTATINPAQFLSMEDRYGSVQEGKIADLVILEKNPLEDISNVQEVRAVVKDGDLLSREELMSIASMIYELNNSDN